MGILYNMTAWTEHIKEFAKTHGITYGVAMKSPECKSAYKKGGETAPSPAPTQDAPKKRGRPKKVVAPAEGGDNIQMVIAEKKPRGRPKKVVAPAEGKGLLEELKKRELGLPNKAIETAKKVVGDRREREIEENNKVPNASPRPTKAGGRKTLAGKGLVSKDKLKKLISKLRADIKHHKGEGRPVDYLQACIKMLQGHMIGGADIQQKGLSAQIRTYLPAGNEDLYKELSFIVHSGDRNPNSHGHNPYADPTNTYDPTAESAVLYAEQLVKGKTHLKKSVAVPRKRGATPPPPSAKKVRADSPLRVSPEMGAKHASASASALKGDAPVFVPKEFVKGKGIATMPSGSRIYPLTLGQVARLARGIV
jgi:hypothetical protein